MRPGFASFFRQTLDAATLHAGDEAVTPEPVGAEPQLATPVPAQQNTEPPPLDDGATTVASGLSWLASLRGNAPMEEPPVPADSKPRQQQEGNASNASLDQKPVLQVSQAARSWAGMCLPVAPFWRTKTVRELEQQHHEERHKLLERIKRIAKDAKRIEQKRHQPRLGL